MTWMQHARAMARWMAPPGSRRRRVLRQVQERALVAYYRWLGQAPLPLPESVEGPGSPRRVLFLYDQSPALRRAFPLGLTPAERGKLVACLLQRRALAPADAAAYLAAAGRDPAQGIVEAYRRSPAWQRAVPHGLTREGWEALKQWLRATYRLGQARWLNLAERVLECGSASCRFGEAQRVSFLEGGALAGSRVSNKETRLRRVKAAAGAAALQDTLGVNVLAHFRYPSGLQVAARHTVRALERHGLAVSCRDVPCQGSIDLPGDHHGLHPWPITISHLAPEPFAEDCYPLAGLAMRSETYRIGYWYWEMEQAPARWARHASWLHEIWAPTRFIRDALRPVMPLPVVEMLPGIEPPPVVEVPRAALGLPERSYLFLFAFDMASTAARKCPHAVIAAFRRAFGERDEVALVLKVSRGSADTAALAQLRRAADGRHIHLIDEVMPRERYFALVNACDAYVSLHRSEGLGLTLAEAMFLGKPVVATRYSGNLDFMNDDNSLLVDWDRVPARDAAHSYREGTWAEPRVDHAAARMRQLVEAPARGRALGEQARRSVREALSLDAAGRRMVQRLEEVARSGNPRPPR